MLWEVYQMGAINSANRSAADASDRARSTERSVKFAENKVRDLERRMDYLTLGCQAMWELLSQNTNLTDDDIKERIMEIDLRDGKADGKMTNSVRPCTNCERPVPRKRDSCLYCGSDVPNNTEVFGK